MEQAFSLGSRRYLGSKYKLRPFIRGVADRECAGVRTVFDAFASTGAVASAFADKRLIVNDLMRCNYIMAQAWFGPGTVDGDKLRALIDDYNCRACDAENYMSQTFGDTYFSAAVCRKIGFVREDADRLLIGGVLCRREWAVLLTSLFYAMDRIAATCGHYDAYIRGAALTPTLTLRMPDVAPTNPANLCLNEDANTLAPRVECDLAYLDPPYNSRQYCDAYHVLENVARWEKPAVRGVARKMERSGMKSEYSKATAPDAFRQLVGRLRARYIMLSYNNNGMGLNARSNAKISDDDIMDILGERGPVQVFTTSYRPFTTGRGENADNQERLFLCTVSE